MMSLIGITATRKQKHNPNSGSNNNNNDRDSIMVNCDNKEGQVASRVENGLDLRRGRARLAANMLRHQRKTFLGRHKRRLRVEARH